MPDIERGFQIVSLKVRPHLPTAEDGAVWGRRVHALSLLSWKMMSTEQQMS